MVPYPETTAGKEYQSVPAAQEIAKLQSDMSPVRRPAQYNRWPFRKPAKNCRAGGSHHPASVQVSAAQPYNGSEPSNIQPGTAVTDSIESGNQHRGSADPRRNEGVIDNRNEATTRNRDIVLSQQQLSNGSSVSSDRAKNSGMGWKGQKVPSNEKRLREKFSKAQLAFQQEKDSWHDTYKQLQAHIDELNNENGRLKRELKEVRSSLADAQTLSQVRAEELRGAQVFLNKADVLSTTEVIQHVTALNNEISQTASRLGELVQNAESLYGRQRQPTEMDNWMLGEQLTSDLYQLSYRHTEPNPLLVQVIFQIAITEWCRSVVSSWEPNNHRLAKSMSAIYSGIRQVEDQAVSGRWRSITRAQLRRSSSNNASWVRDFMQEMKGILNIAGWSIRGADQQQFEWRIPPLSKAVQNLRKALGEDVTSMDIEVIKVEAGQNFDPNYMEDSFGDGRSSSRNGRKATPEKVVGATGLGLLTRKGQTDEYEIILLPQVALEGVLKEAKKAVLTKPQRRLSTRYGNRGSRPGTAASNGVSP